MKLSTRYGIISLAALATLGTAHWVRGNITFDLRAMSFVLGVAPNFAASIAIIFVFMGTVAAQEKYRSYQSYRLWFSILAAVSLVGLIGWEVFQLSSRKLVFDPYDIVFTVIGICTAFALFLLSTFKDDSARMRNERSEQE